MSSSHVGASRRLAAGFLGIAILFLGLGASVGHDGPDHGAPQAAVTSASLRVAAQSETYGLVGLVRNGRLTVYLDRFRTNEPVADAKLVVTVGGVEEVTAAPAPDGTYTMASPKFAGRGPVELVFAVNGPAGDDLLIGTLQLPEAPAAPILLQRSVRARCASPGRTSRFPTYRRASRSRLAFSWVSRSAADASSCLPLGSQS